MNEISSNKDIKSYIKTSKDFSQVDSMRGFYVSGSNLKPLKSDTLNLEKYKSVSFYHKGANVQLSEQNAFNSAVDVDVIKRLPGYTDSNGEVLPYLFVEGFNVKDRGKGNGKKIFGEIIKLAQEQYGGRLLLKPQNRDCNPSPFYYKCGMRSTTEKGAKEIEEYFEHGKPFESGYSDPMYLPVESVTKINTPKSATSKLSPDTYNWKLYTNDGFEAVLEAFSEQDAETKELVNLAKTYKLKFSLQKAIANPKMFKNILDKLSEVFGVDLYEPPKVYRFIGDEELAVLQKEGTVKPTRYTGTNKMDVTINPELNWNKYRLTFKQSPTFSIFNDSQSKIEPNLANEKEGYFYVRDGYGIDDVETIEVFDGEKYVKL